MRNLAAKSDSIKLSCMSSHETYFGPRSSYITLRRIVPSQLCSTPLYCRELASLYENKPMIRRPPVELHLSTHGVNCGSPERRPCIAPVIASISDLDGERCPPTCIVVAPRAGYQSLVVRECSIQKNIHSLNATGPGSFRDDT